MPSYKLYYFDAAGRAETIRFMLLYGGIPFEDYRFGQDKWPEVKAKMPFGQVPVLEVDGKFIATSSAIGRFVAKLIKAYGDTDFEAAQIDSLVDLYQDLLPKLRETMAAIMQNNEELKKTEWAKVRDDFVTTFGHFETRLKQNGTGYLVGNKLSWADFLIGELGQKAEEKLDPTILADFPKLKELYGKFCSLPQLKDYIQSRKPSVF